MIYVIEDDPLMRECIAEAAGSSGEVRCFGDAIAAVQSLDNSLPDLIFLDILLPGPDGFTFLNELASYADTAEIPIVLVSSLNFKGQELGAYNIVGALDKETMTPAEIRGFAKQYGVAKTRRREVAHA